MVYICTCDGVEERVLASSNKVAVFGRKASRYLNSEWYNVIDVDPVLFKCKGTRGEFNFNYKENKCY